MPVHEVSMPAALWSEVDTVAAAMTDRPSRNAAMRTLVKRGLAYTSLSTALMRIRRLTDNPEVLAVCAEVLESDV